MEREVLEVRRGDGPGGLVFLLGALTLAVGLFGLLPIYLARNDQPLQAAILAIFGGTMVYTWLVVDSGPRRALRELAGVVLEGLGGRRTLSVGAPAGGGRSLLSLEVRLGRLRWPIVEPPLDEVVEVRVTKDQGGSPTLYVAAVREGPLFEACASPQQAHALVAAVERWRAEAVTLDPPARGPRCAICHGPASDEALVTCPGCATGLHAACELELGGRCPTLGCARAAAPAAGPRLDRLELPELPEREGRVGVLGVAALMVISVALLARGLTRGSAAELIQGGLLGALTIVPAALSLASDPRGFLRTLLSSLAAPGRRTVAIDRTACPPLLTIGWRLGPVHLRLERLALGVHRLEVSPSTRGSGWDVSLSPLDPHDLSSPVFHRLGDGLGPVDVRRLEDLLDLRATDHDGAPLLPPTDARPSPKVKA